MKIINISDLHGLGYWKKIVSDNTWNRVVFLGDYFDSFNITYLEQMSNFRDILDFKKQHGDNVILLLGNHDFHYLKGTQDRYPGFQNIHSFDIQKELEDNIHLFKIAYNFDKYLFSHAGFTNTWLKNHNIDTENIGKISYFTNQLFLEKREPFGFLSYDDRLSDPYRNDPYQGPLWVRPKSLVNDGFKNCVQIVGHTKQNNGVTTQNNCYFTDTLSNKDLDYLTIDNGIIQIKPLEEKKVFTSKFQKDL